MVKVTCDQYTWNRIKQHCHREVHCWPTFCFDNSWNCYQFKIWQCNSPWNVHHTLNKLKTFPPRPPPSWRPAHCLLTGTTSAVQQNWGGLLRRLLWRPLSSSERETHRGFQSIGPGPKHTAITNSWAFQGPSNFPYNLRHFTFSPQNIQKPWQDYFEEKEMSHLELFWWNRADKWKLSQAASSENSSFLSTPTVPSGGPFSLFPTVNKSNRTFFDFLKRRLLHVLLSLIDRCGTCAICPHFVIMHVPLFKRTK